MRIIDPYREENQRALRFLDSLSHAEFWELLKEVGILDKRGNLAKRYRTPKDELPAKSKTPKRRTPRQKKLARPKAAKPARKRAAS